MDITGYSSVGTQTPTEHRSFEFPECFSPSPQLSSSSVSSSSIGTQTSVRQRSSYESTDDRGSSSQRPRLFRRHSTGSDVYDFSSSPTLLTAFGGVPLLPQGILRRRMFIRGDSAKGNIHQNPTEMDYDDDGNEDVESVGQQLRKIGDDLDRGGSFRSRSLSLSRFFVHVRRRTSSTSS